MDALDRLEPIHEETVDAILAHPMVAGIGDGVPDHAGVHRLPRPDRRDAAAPGARRGPVALHVGFNETAERLAADGVADDERYAEWIETDAGEAFAELTDWCKGLYAELTADAAAVPERCEALFETSARYEYRFWDAAWRGEGWSV